MKKIVFAFALTLLLLVGSASATFTRACPAGSYLTGEGDEVAYANEIVYESGAVSQSDNAIGIDDNTYAYIHPTNPDSFIVLDMGEGEEVWDRFGLDFKVYQDNSRDDWGVQVYVSNSPNSGWQYVGFSDGRGDDQFTIAFTSYDSIRYVKIVNTDRDTGRFDQAEVVEIDAIRGYCISEPSEEVPEFGALAGLAVLGLAGAFIFKRRN